MDITTYIMIPGINLTYLSETQDEYGTNHMNQVVAEKQLIHN